MHDSYLVLKFCYHNWNCENQNSYVCGNGWLNTGGNLTGSLGFGSGAGFVAFGATTGAAFLEACASDGVFPAGFGAVIDGIGGGVIDDGVETDVGTSIY